MAMRIIASLVLIGVGSFAIYTVWAKPGHSWSGEAADQAIGISEGRHENDPRSIWLVVYRHRRDRNTKNLKDTLGVATLQRSTSPCWVLLDSAA